MSYGGPEYERRRYASRVAQRRCVRGGEKLPKDWPHKTCAKCLAEVRENARDNYWTGQGKEIPATVMRRGPRPAPLPVEPPADELDACRCDGPCDCSTR